MFPSRPVFNSTASFSSSCFHNICDRKCRRVDVQHKCGRRRWLPLLEANPVGRQWFADISGSPSRKGQSPALQLAPRLQRHGACHGSRHSRERQGAGCSARILQVPHLSACRFSGQNRIARASRLISRSIKRPRGPTSCRIRRVVASVKRVSSGLAGLGLTGLLAYWGGLPVSTLQLHA